jgi:uncharacterized protein (DUF1800 family)
MVMTTPSPETAWLPWEPSATEPWNAVRIAHLYRRTCFGASWSEIERAAQRPPHEVIAEIVTGRPASAAAESTPAPWESFETGLAPLKTAVAESNNLEQAQALWLYRMLHSPHRFREKVTLFWHNHFATSAAKVRDLKLMVRQNELLRTHALGRFDELLWLATIDAAMIVWLDSASNRKGHPNENYARELMELFSLGVGNYTEKDIQEAARALTGWRVASGRPDFRINEFDSGEKTVFGQTGAWQAKDIVRLCTEQPACSRFVVRKLIAEFVGPDFATDELVTPLADWYRTDGYSTERLLQRMISSRLFFSDEARWTIVKSPVALLVGLVRSLEGRVGPDKLAKACDQLGQSLLRPPSVKGWDGGAEWINSTTLLRRQNIAFDATKGTGDALRLDPARLAETYGLNGHEEIAGFFLRLFYQREDESVRSTIVNEMNRTARDPAYVLAADHRQKAIVRTAAHLALTLPEFQLS